MTSKLTEQDVAPLWAKANDEEGGQFNPRAVVAMFANDVLMKWGGVSEAEAREREREAFTEGANAHRGSYGQNVSEFVAAVKESRYPLLLPKRPTVILSTGEWEAKSDHHGGFDWRSTDTIEWVGYPKCVTAEDFEKCAALVRGAHA